MSELKKEISVENATVPFYEYFEGDIRVIEFDSSQCVPPEPMVNAMSALELLKDSNTKIVMINHRSPVGLFPKIGENFGIDEQELEDGRVKIVFTYKEGMSDQADLSDKSCNG